MQRIRTALAIGFIAVGLGCSRPPRASTDDAVIAEFRRVERTALQTYNGLLRQQRANAIDELGLAEAIDRDVLPVWRTLRTRVDQAVADPADRELYIVLRRYLAERQMAWEAFVVGLRSPSDEAAKPHYARYHEQDAAAVSDARKLGEAFRKH